MGPQKPSAEASCFRNTDHGCKQMTTPNEALANDLQSVLDGVKKLETVLDDPLHLNGPLGACFHGLQHYLMDEDIRERDDGYRRMQEGEMRELIRLLRLSANDVALARVSFLGSS